MPPPPRKKPSGESGPEALGEILSRLFTARGWGRRQARLHLEEAWAEAAGPDIARQTRVEALRRGVLEVAVEIEDTNMSELHQTEERDDRTAEQIVAADAASARYDPNSVQIYKDTAH